MDENQIKIKLGLRINQFRLKLGLTQEELAEKINRTQRQVSLIEVGNCFPSPVTIAKLIEVFNCSIRDLFDFEPVEDAESIRNEFQNLLTKLPDDKLKILYWIGKNI